MAYLPFEGKTTRNSKNGIYGAGEAASKLWGSAGVYEVYRLENFADVVNSLMKHWVIGFQNL
jgi:hypothetical protein